MIVESQFQDVKYQHFVLPTSAQKAFIQLFSHAWCYYTRLVSTLLMCKMCKL